MCEHKRTDRTVRTSFRPAEVGLPRLKPVQTVLSVLTAQWTEWTEWTSFRPGSAPPVTARHQISRGVLGVNRSIQSTRSTRPPPELIGLIGLIGRLFRRWHHRRRGATRPINPINPFNSGPQFSARPPASHPRRVTLPGIISGRRRRSTGEGLTAPAGRPGPSPPCPSPVRPQRGRRG